VPSKPGRTFSGSATSGAKGTTCEPLGWVMKYDSSNRGSCAHTGGLQYPCHALRDETSNLCLTARPASGVKSSTTFSTRFSATPESTDFPDYRQATDDSSEFPVGLGGSAAPYAYALSMDNCDPVSVDQQFLLDPLTGQLVLNPLANPATYWVTTNNQALTCAGDEYKGNLGKDVTAGECLAAVVAKSKQSASSGGLPNLNYAVWHWGLLHVSAARRCNSEAALFRCRRHQLRQTRRHPTVCLRQ
jgi:hypothetical protein